MDTTMKTIDFVMISHQLCDPTTTNNITSLQILYLQEEQQRLRL